MSMFGSRAARIATAFGILLSVAAVVGCDDDETAEGETTASTTFTATGGERLAWDQEAPSLRVVNSYTFTAFVDGVIAGALSASCSGTSDSSTFTCNAPLPTLPRGIHLVAIRTTDADGGSSALSTRISITVQASSATPSTTSLSAIAETAVESLARVCLGEGTNRGCYQLTRVAKGLGAPEQPTELPDGRLAFVDGGRLLQVQNGQVQPVLIDGRIGARVADVAVPLGNDATREVYVLEVSATADVRSADVVRFRDVNGVLGQRAVIVSRIPLPAQGDPALVVDDSITVAVPAASTRAGTGSGTILRYDREGRSAGRAIGSPALALGLRAPSALLKFGDRLAMAGVERDASSFAVLAPGQTVPAATIVGEQLAAAGGVRSAARTGSLVLLAAADGSAWLSAVNADGDLASPQRVDTRGAAITGLTATRQGTVVATAVLSSGDRAVAGRVYTLVPIVAEDRRLVPQ